ncbi:MAG TPA: hypothetical protein VGG72_08635 [Bryobacteraceae bacterium]
MRERHVLESLIVTELRDLKGLESKLDQRFAGLRVASPRTRASFLRGLMDLDERARGLEELIDALAAGVSQSSSASALI